MKPNRTLFKIAAEVLAAEAHAPAPVSTTSRANAIRGMTDAIRARKRQRRMRWYAAGTTTLCAAATILLVAGRAHHSSAERVASRAAAPASATLVRGAPVVLRHGTRRALSDGASLDIGDRVVAPPGSRVSISLARGTFLTIDHHAELVFAMAAPETMFELGAGAVHADVTKLTPNERFVIRTADAEVEVRGTSFQVSVVEPDPSCGNGTRTRVEVREGTVAVRAGGSESLVPAGGSWPRGCVATQVAKDAVGAPSSEPPPSSAARVPDEVHGSSIRGPKTLGAAGAGGPPRLEAPASSSDLAKENDLYERALTKKRGGDPRGAALLLDDLIAHYPAGPLAQSASAERMKLLRDVDDQRARTLAREYLKRYPNGFARRDAELVLSSPTP